MNPTAVRWLGEVAGFGSVINAALNIFIYSAKHEQLRAYLKAALLCREQPDGLGSGSERTNVPRKRIVPGMNVEVGGKNENPAQDNLPAVG